MPDAAAISGHAQRLQLLGDPTRLTIVCALAQGETNPSCLAELAGVAAPAVSQHLTKLRLAGICRARRAGQQVWYELIDDDVRHVVDTFLIVGDPVGH